MTKYFIAGGAGFIGSHLTVKILGGSSGNSVKIYDNFSSGKRWHLDPVKNHPDLEITEGDIKDIELLTAAMKGSDVVYHFASNPDISKAMTQPDIDFWEGTYLTNNVIEAMRRNSVKKLIYASGSGIYGDTGYLNTDENYTPMRPISTYGASKLSCEALICSYCCMFDMTAAAFRFANVVGPHQTHGVGYDFVRKLLQDKSRLEILGDGSQSKSYIYVDDVISAMRMIEESNPGIFDSYNVATEDYISVKEIADVVTGIMNIKDVNYVFSGGDRGWKGDVPIVRLNSEKIRSLGWKNKYSAKEAIYNSVKSIFEDASLNKFNWKDKK